MTLHRQYWVVNSWWNLIVSHAVVLRILVEAYFRHSSYRVEGEQEADHVAMRTHRAIVVDLWLGAEWTAILLGV